jgi:hypothetical protein
MKSIVLTLLLSLAACTHGARLTAPTGFADLGDADHYSYRAANARGIVLATRTEPNDVKANTDFWAETLDLKLRERGYTAEPSRTVKTARGLEGTQLRYTTARDGRPFRYWLTVFATKSKVYVVEVGGDKEAFDGQLAAIENAVSTLDASD